MQKFLKPPSVSSPICYDHESSSPSVSLECLKAPGLSLQGLCTGCCVCPGHSPLPHLADRSHGPLWSQPRWHLLNEALPNSGSLQKHSLSSCSARHQARPTSTPPPPPRPSWGALEMQQHESKGHTHVLRRREETWAWK